MNERLEYIASIWPSIKDILSVPHSEEEDENLVALLDRLLDEVKGNEQHPLASLVDTIGTFIEIYEDETLDYP